MTDVPLGGRRLGKYRIAHQIGAGGSGAVYFGIDDAGMAYAIKVLHPHVAVDPDSRHRLVRELETLQRVRHPAVAQVVDADVVSSTPYIVTRYLPGPSLQDLVDRGGPLTGRALVQLGNGMGQALAAIHGNGVVHRDLKPGNVLIMDSGDPVVIDFGIAHAMDDSRLTSYGLVMGTPGYLSPETLRGDQIDRSTDWWAWAATMVFAATGRAPFGSGPSGAVMDRVRRGEVCLDGVPSQLRVVLRRALQPDRTLRPAPQELRVALLDLYDASVPAADHAAGLGSAAAPKVQSGPRTVTLPREASGPLPQPATALLPESLPPLRAPKAQQSWRTPAATALIEPTPPVRPTPTGPPTRQMAPPPPTGPYAQWHGPPPAQPQHPAQQYPVQPQQQLRFPSPRSGSVFISAVVVCLIAGIAPVAGFVIALVIGVLARTVERAHAAIWRRRLDRGPARQDPVLVALASPYHLIRAALSTALNMVLPLLVGASVLYVLNSMAAGQLPGMSLGGLAKWHSLRLVCAAAAVFLAAWWGPGGTGLRRGSRMVLRAVSPGRTGTTWYAAGMGLVAMAAVLVLSQHPAPDWLPLAGPPLDWLGW